MKLFSAPKEVLAIHLLAALNLPRGMDEKISNLIEEKKIEPKDIKSFISQS